MKIHQSKPDFVTRLFDQVKLIDKKSWKERLSNHLGISYSTLYKKARGATALTATEMKHIIDLYQIPIFEVFRDYANFTQVKCPALANPITSVKDHLDNMACHLGEDLHHNSGHIYHASSEIPLFHYLHSPELTAFKFAVWAKTIWSIDSDTGLETIILKLLVDKEFNATRRKVLHRYCLLESTELWPSSVLDNTLNQLYYFIWSLEMKDPKLIQDILDQTDLLINHFEIMADTGKKSQMGHEPLVTHKTYTLYYNEIFQANNTIIVDQENQSTILIAHDEPNYMRCEDPQFYQHTKAWMQRMTQMSTKISLENARHRKRYFSILRGKVSQLRVRIESISPQG